MAQTPIGRRFITANDVFLTCHCFRSVSSKRPFNGFCAFHHQIHICIEWDYCSSHVRNMYTWRFITVPTFILYIVHTTLSVMYRFSVYFVLSLNGRVSFLFFLQSVTSFSLIICGAQFHGTGY